MNPAEKATVKAFIAPEHVTQYLSRLSMAKARIDFINRRFYHMYDLNPQYASRIDPGGQWPAAIYEVLRSKGAPDDCYVFGGSDLDQAVVPLADAVEATVGWSNGTFI